jgi:hypothetical protein
MMSSIRVTTTAVLLVVALIPLASAAAGQEGDSAEATPPDTQAFSAVLSGSVSFEPLEAATDECPLGVRTVTDASGQTTLGEVTLHAEHCPTPGLPSVPAGVQRLTTADGDELSGPYFVDCDPVLPSAEAGEAITCVGRFQIAEGTGRFAGATGMTHQTAFIWFPGSREAQAWPWVSMLEGVVSY